MEGLTPDFLYKSFGAAGVIISLLIAALVVVWRQYIKGQDKTAILLVEWAKAMAAGVASDAALRREVVQYQEDTKERIESYHKQNLEALGRIESAISRKRD